MTEVSEEETVKAVAERLRFFFSDANIRGDRFLRRFLKKDADDFSGSVPIEVLLRFNSIKRYTQDEAIVVKAAKTISDVLKLEDSDKALARVDAFTAADMNSNIPLSLFVTNLPLKDEDSKSPRYDTSVNEVKELFKPYGDVALVRFLFQKIYDNNGRVKHKRGGPKGHAQVEYSTAEGLEKAAADLLTVKDGVTLEPKKTLEVKGNKLTVMLLTEHIENKKKEDAEKKESGEKDNSNKKGEDDGGDGENNDASKKRKEPEFTIDWKPGCVIELKGLGSSCDREALRESMKEHTSAEIYIDYSRGQTNGAIRFTEPSDEVKDIAEKLAKGDIKIQGNTVLSARVLEGDEEKKYWEAFIEFKSKQIRHRNQERNSRKKFRR